MSKFRKGDYVKLTVDLEYSRHTKGNIVQISEVRSGNKYQVCLDPFASNCERKHFLVVGENKITEISKRDERKICDILQKNVNNLELILKEQKEQLAIMIEKLYK